MDRSEVIRRFNACEEVVALIRAARARRLKKALIGTACMLAAAIAICIIFTLSPLKCGILCAAAIALSAVAFKAHKLFSESIPVVGTVAEIRHDYQTGVQKGTEGWGDANIYTSIRRYHNTVLVLKSPIEAEPDSLVACPPQCERMFTVGDIVLYHPELPYPCNLSSRMTCICARCGTAQSADNFHCYNCHLPLFNYTTMS